MKICQNTQQTVGSKALWTIAKNKRRKLRRNNAVGHNVEVGRNNAERLPKNAVYNAVAALLESLRDQIFPTFSQNFFGNSEKQNCVCVITVKLLFISSLQNLFFELTFLLLLDVVVTPEELAQAPVPPIDEASSK